MLEISLSLKIADFARIVKTRPASMFRLAGFSPGGRDRSLTRDTADSLLRPHDASEDVAEMFSPGRAPLHSSARARQSPSRAPRVVLIVEILADPPPGDAGDANDDGVRNTYEDEFVELLGLENVDIGGWSLSDDDTDEDQRFHFPTGTRISAGGRVVLFGGGSFATGASIFSDDGRIGNGLTNGGDVVILRNAAGDTIDMVNGNGWTANRASSRTPESCLTGCDWRPHGGAGSAVRFSPGTR